MKANSKFWICWLPDGGLPRVKHETEQKATEEARRICEIEGKPVYVCECIGVATQPTVPAMYFELRGEDKPQPITCGAPTMRLFGDVMLKFDEQSE